MTEKYTDSGHSETPIVPEVFEGLDAIVEPDPLGEHGAFSLTFKEDTVTVTMRVSLTDYSDAELMITNVTTLPYDQAGHGYGSRAVHKLMQWAKSKGIHDIRATQIQKKNEPFWHSNGFVKMPDPNPTNDHKWVDAPDT